MSAKGRSTGTPKDKFGEYGKDRVKNDPEWVLCGMSMVVISFSPGRVELILRI